MVINISVAFIAVAFVVLVVFLIVALLETRKTLRSTRKDIRHVATEAVELMKKIDTLAADIRSKVDSLDFVFRPLKSLNKEKPHKETDTVTEVVEWATTSLILFNKIKAAVRGYEK